MVLWDYPDNVTSFYSLTTYINYATGNWFGPLILIAVWFIVFLAIKIRYPLDRAITVPSFLCFILAVLMRAMDIIGDLVLFVFIVLTGISAIYMLINKERF